MNLFFAALLLGLVFNATPGAVFAETVRQGARGGFRPALAVQIGSLVGDASWAVLGLLGVGLLLQAESLRLPVGVAGVAYLLWLARDSWRAANQVFEIGGAQAERRALRAGVLLSVTNPQNVAYWAALGSAMGALGVTDPTSRDYVVFFAGFMASSLLWSFFCAAVVARLFRDASQRWVRLTYRLCALAFLALALASARELVRREPAPRPLSGDRPAITHNGSVASCRAADCAAPDEPRTFPDGPVPFGPPSRPVGQAAEARDLRVLLSR